jgi:hypothetical protein
MPYSPAVEFKLLFHRNLRSATDAAPLAEALALVPQDQRKAVLLHASVLHAFETRGTSPVVDKWLEENLAGIGEKTLKLTFSQS